MHACNNRAGGTGKRMVVIDKGFGFWRTMRKK